MDQAQQQVLVIDDDQTTLMLIKRYLSEIPVRVHTAEDARRGLQTLKDGEDIGLVLVDYMMPQMTGVEVLHAVQEMTPPPYILLISSLEEDQIPSGLHADGFLKKPISKTNLQEVVKEGLGKYRDRCKANQHRSLT
ncbi:MAG: response regulator [Nitrospina sp.]|nr:response regulator [Nitrospina sp.]